MRKNDFFLILFILFLAMSYYFYNNGAKESTNTAQVVIFQNKQQVYNNTLKNFPPTLTLTTLHGEIIVQKENNKLKIGRAHV